MKVGVVSDTHDNVELAREAVKFLEERVAVVIHCGDVIAPFTAELFESSFRFHCVRGNNDGEWNLQETVEEFGTYHGELAELEIAGKDIGVYHGTSEAMAESMRESGKYDYVFRGHTHQRGTRESGDTVEVNPGGIKLPGQDEEFSVAVVDLEEEEVEFQVIE
jgi:putative phosphoesterase